MPLIFFLLLEFAASAKGNAIPRKECSKLDLSRKDCTLKLDSYRVHLSKLKITFHDGAWESIADFPMADDKFDWDQATLEKLGGRYILGLWVWDGGQGEA